MPLRILTTANVLEQGSVELGVISALHVGVVVGIMWVLLWNALIATQSIA
jgi:hypothetical protein